MTEVIKKIRCPLQNKKVVVRVIISDDAFFESINKEHVALGGYPSAKKTFCAPINSITNNIINPLTADEQEWFESSECNLGFKPGDLSSLKKKDNFWSSTTNEIVLTKEGKTYDLSSPEQYLKYVILRANKEYIAPSWEQRYNRGTYMFALCDGDEDVKSKIKKTDLLKDAWREYGKIDESVNKLYDFLCVYYIKSKKKDLSKPKHNMSLDELRIEVSDIIDKDIDNFLSIIKSNDYHTVVLIAKSILLGEIIPIEKGLRYHIKSVDYKGTMPEIVSYLKDIKLQSEKLRLENIIDEQEKKS